MPNSFFCAFNTSNNIINIIIDTIFNRKSEKFGKNGLYKISYNVYYLSLGLLF